MVIIMAVRLYKDVESRQIDIIKNLCYYYVTNLINM
jgi:hypothetical protein